MDLHNVIHRSKENQINKIYGLHKSYSFHHDGLFEIKVNSNRNLIDELERDLNVFHNLIIL